VHQLSTDARHDIIRLRAVLSINAQELCRGPREKRTLNSYEIFHAVVVSPTHNIFTTRKMYDEGDSDMSGP